MDGRKESRRAVARVYVCALHRIMCRCGVQQLSRVISFLYMGRHEASRWRKTHASQPKVRDFSTSRCARAEKVPSTSALSFSHSVGSRRLGVTPFSRVTRVNHHLVNSLVRTLIRLTHLGEPSSG